MTHRLPTRNFPAAAGAVHPPAGPLPQARPADTAAAPALHSLGGRPAAGQPAPQLWAALHLPAITPQALTQLAAAALEFTPRVSVAPPDGLLLEVQGSLHLFAGLTGLRAALIRACAHLPARPALAFAPTALAALVAARAGRSLAVTDLGALTGQLAPLPLAALRWPPDTLARLKRMGVRTIGAALRLPRAGFARRFGAAPLAMLDVLTARAPEALRSFNAPARFRGRRVLGYELENHQALLGALAPLFADLAVFLRTRQCGVLEFECRFRHRHAAPTRCVVRLAAPATDAARLAALLGEHLGALTLPEPVRECELRAEALVAHQPGSHPLWQAGEHGGGGAGHEGADLIERLRARLGAEAVHGLALCEGHRPEKAWARTAPPPAGRRGRRDSPAATPAPRRPLWLLPLPRRLRMRDGLPRRRGPLHLVSEPERIESGWWDGGEVARDYYIAVDIHGVRLWIFRERAAPHGWYLHGVFG